MKNLPFEVVMPRHLYILWITLLVRISSTTNPQHLVDDYNSTVSLYNRSLYPTFRSNEYRVKLKILRGYDKTSRPVLIDSSTVEVSVGMTLFHILDTNEKFQTLSSLISVRLRWTDEYLRWNASDFSNLTKIWLPSNRIWVPDIVISNYADNSYNDMISTNALVMDKGTVLWMYPSVSKTYCKLNVRFFPFDVQACKLSFYSWTYSGYQLNLTYASDRDINQYNPQNQEWYVDNITVTRRISTYVCCPDPFPDVTFTIHMRRRSLFYIVNLIFPCILIYTVSLMGFFLPVQSGEKVNLEITILLALVVFLLIAGETLPPTPDAIPILGVLYGVTMLMVSLALLMAVVVTNIYLRKNNSNPVPHIFARILRKKAPSIPTSNANHQYQAYRLTQHNTVPSRCNWHSGNLPNSFVSSNSMLHSNPADNNKSFSDQSAFSTNNFRGEYIEMEETEEEELVSLARPMLANALTRKEKEPTPKSSLVEWTDVALFVDRVFFWIFLTLSLSFFVTLVYVISIQQKAYHPDYEESD